MPIPATKKKFPMYTFVVVTPRHSIKLIESVVRVVAKAPIASAVCLVSAYFSGQSEEHTGLPSP